MYCFDSVMGDRYLDVHVQYSYSYRCPVCSEYKKREKAARVAKEREQKRVRQFVLLSSLKQTSDKSRSKVLAIAWQCLLSM